MNDNLLAQGHGKNLPLAVRMRPATLKNVLGQEHLTHPGTPLARLADPEYQQQPAVSMILYGPPGTGKSTLAQAAARDSQRPFMQLSAPAAGVKEIRQIMEQAQRHKGDFGVAPILFLDEIHRFSKSQQDSLLKGVEDQLAVLLAATTENPFYSVNPALLSRSVILNLKPLEPAALDRVLEEALNSPQGLDKRFTLSDQTRQQLLLLAGGDARRLLTLLEAAAAAAESAQAPEDSAEKSQPRKIELAQLEAVAERAGVVYGQGDHYDTISAFIKSVRGSDPDAALHYLARMIVAGEDPRYICRRLIILAAEDIGLADPQALTLAAAAKEAVETIGMPEGRIPLAEVTIYLALAPKSNTAYQAINAAIAEVEAGHAAPVPAWLLSGAKRGYVYPHDLPNRVARQQYLPDAQRHSRYYYPGELGFEKSLLGRFENLLRIVRDKEL